MDLPHVGELFEERYELLEMLGRGGFATVFRAADLSMRRDVVIKVLSPTDGGYGATIAARFMREARVFATLQNPNTITMYDFGESRDGLLYMVFEYVHGQELAALLRDGGPLSADIVVHLLLQLLSALQEAHEHGVLHRDIKPANVLVYAYDGDPYRVKLLDFGIAKDTGPDAQRITVTGRVVGTLRYMAPEQLVGDSVGPETDIFSLGLVATELLTGAPVIGGQSQKELIQGQISEAPLLVPAALAPPELRAVIERMMARDREARFGSAASVISAIRAARRGPEEVVSATTRQEAVEPAGAESAPRTSRSRSLVFAASAAIGALAAGLMLWPAEPAAPPQPPPMRRAVSLVSQVAEPEPSPIDDVEDAGVPDAQAVPGQCEIPPFVGLGELRIRLLDTPVTAYIPESWDPENPPGLALVFHRMFRDGHAAILDSQIGPVAEKYGWVVLAPNSESPTSWRSMDVAHAQHLIDAAQEHLCLDRSRVFAIGDRGGAFAANHLACSRPVSGVVATFDVTAKTCDPLSPTARMRIYGRNDPYLPVEGGMGCNPLAGPAPRASGIEGNWRNVYGCSGTPKPWGSYLGGECRAWDCSRGPLVFCETDLTHHWPGSDGPILATKACMTRPPEHQFPMAAAIGEFFERHGHRIEPADTD